MRPIVFGPWGAPPQNKENEVLELKVRDGETEVVLEFEHSLRSLSKWESKNKTPFLSSAMKSATEMIDYFQDMLLTKIEPSIVYRLSPEQLDDLKNYINSVQTASSVPKEPNSRGTGEIVTSELIYYWMTALKINWEAQNWHLSRLMMLIEITGYKSKPEKERSKADMLRNWNELNERNKKLFNTEG